MENRKINQLGVRYVIVPNSFICMGRGGLGIGDDFGSAFLFTDNMHGPTCLRGIVWNANNMP